MPYVTEAEYSKMIDDVVKAQKAEDAARAEITQLRAELAAERELADRLAKALDRMWIHQTPSESPEPAELTAHAARRNK